LLRIIASLKLGDAGGCVMITFRNELLLGALAKLVLLEVESPAQTLMNVQARHARTRCV